MKEAPGRFWDVTAIAGHLHTTVDVRHDFDRGEDYTRLVVGDTQAAEIALFPQGQRVRITTRTSRIELAGVEPPTIAPSGVVFEYTVRGEQVRLALSPSGGLVFGLSPAASETEPANVAEQIAEASVPGEQPKDTERQDRVTMRGRLAAPPQFQRTSKNKLKGEFALYVREPEAAEDVRRAVLVFDDRARRLQEKGLKAADQLEVIAYPHHRTMRRRDGTTREIDEFYATAVKRIGAAPSEGAPRNRGSQQ